jgi:hypothetical protein
MTEETTNTPGSGFHIFHRPTSGTASPRSEKEIKVADKSQARHRLSKQVASSNNNSLNLIATSAN